jgi:hypothetical protein
MWHERPHALIRRYRRTRRVKVPWPGQGETRCRVREPDTRWGGYKLGIPSFSCLFDVGGRCLVGEQGGVGGRQASNEEISDCTLSLRVAMSKKGTGHWSRCTTLASDGECGRFLPTGQRQRCRPSGCNC